MKRPSKILPLLLVVIVAAITVYAQTQRGTVTGIVLDRDGKTPLAGASVQIDSLIKNSDCRDTATRTQDRVSIRQGCNESPCEKRR